VTSSPRSEDPLSTSPILLNIGSERKGEHYPYGTYFTPRENSPLGANSNCSDSQDTYELLLRSSSSTLCTRCTYANFLLTLT
jgi:hypothetical protein